MIARSLAGASLDEVVQALNALRDTLVTVSLLLQDYRFEMDEAARREVAAAVNELLSKTRKSP